MIREKLEALKGRLRDRWRRRPRMAWDAHSNRIVFVQGMVFDDKGRRTSHAPPKTGTGKV
jgi:hypothetical protein